MKAPIPPEEIARERLQVRVHGPATLPTLVYLPGIHGDWTLVGSFRKAIEGRVRFVEFTYPRTLTWSMEEYAQAVDAALREQGIVRGWVLAESFGSQIVWPWLKKPEPRFQIEGVILAGGFVQHPALWGVRLAKFFSGRLPLRWIKCFLFLYAKYARLRHRRAPETRQGIQQFIDRRTELDRQAARHRLELILKQDWRETACQTAVPVYLLSGFLDPIVPWPWSNRWIRRHCPGFREGKIILRSDHNVLGVAPRESVEQVLRWMQNGTQPAASAESFSKPSSMNVVF